MSETLPGVDERTLQDVCHKMNLNHPTFNKGLIMISLLLLLGMVCLDHDEEACAKKTMKIILAIGICVMLLYCCIVG
jgi:hypothetical protein